MGVAIEVASVRGKRVIKVTGDYGIGSEGNGDAELILEALRAELARADERQRVVLDLSAMTYEWGNAIGAVFEDEESDFDIVLGKRHAQAWNGLLTLCVDPLWKDLVGDRIRFV